MDRIVLITIDTLRADHLPEFGYPTDTAPFLTSLSAQGVTFRRAFSHSATTGPSHASLFTSLYPLQHGVQNNGQKLDPSFVTVAEALSQQSFSTAAFVSGMALFGQSQIAQGFSHYDQPSAAEMRDERGRLSIYRPADRTTDTALAWLGQRPRDERAFVWVHYYDPHRPLNPPEQHLRQVDPSTSQAMRALERFLTEEHRATLRGRDLRRIVEYDAEIHFVDAQIERLYRTLEADSDGRTTLWVITSDHGQGLGNHGWFGHHRNIYNEQLHVPLIFHFSSGHRRGRVVDNLVEHVDVPVTILDLVGDTLDDQVDRIQGQSLVPLLMSDAPVEHKQVAYSERRRLLRRTDRASYEPGERYSLQSREAKYQWFSEGPDEFYDLASDPYETNNLIDEPSAAKDELAEALRQIVASLDADHSGEIVDEATLERLRALGYLR